MLIQTFIEHIIMQVQIELMHIKKHGKNIIDKEMSKKQKRKNIMGKMTTVLLLIPTLVVFSLKLVLLLLYSSFMIFGK